LIAQASAAARDADVHGGPGLVTCLGPDRTEGLVRAVGFTRFWRLPISTRSSLFYAARG